ncbi:CoA ester lyase [Natronomonas gomsonensis]|uniref:HpcH/HpaI aldolase/citrate lyase family protein n=1 Tax=Natronomonas gomsonensis TaxID=1046043 RepID=UPI00227B9B05|nr:CoA ester lyase [Natronomonas gomsonensis]MCY4729934.1 CoA ester lyase [Natronomonas gomsonensis]
MRVRRSELTTPGVSLDMMKKAAASAADEVMLDLEDAVAPDEKEIARERIVRALDEFDWAKTVVSVRINGLDHPNSYRDLVDVVEAAGNSIDTIVVPKVRQPEDVYVVSTLLDQIEAATGITDSIGIEVLIEETEALQQVDNIAAASDRLETLIFGPGDYAAAQGISVDHPGGQPAPERYPGDVWHYARNRIVVAARANGLDAIDGPFADFSNPEGYRQECRWSQTLGFVGKWAIHPSQIEIANEEYRPDAEAVERAQEIVDAMESGHESGQGAVQVDGEMLDEAVLRSARRTLARARQVGMVNDALNDDEN